MVRPSMEIELLRATPSPSTPAVKVQWVLCSSV